MPLGNSSPKASLYQIHIHGLPPTFSVNSVQFVETLAAASDYRSRQHGDFRHMSGDRDRGTCANACVVCPRKSSNLGEEEKNSIPGCSSPTPATKHAVVGPLKRIPPKSYQGFIDNNAILLPCPSGDASNAVPSSRTHHPSRDLLITRPPQWAPMAQNPWG